MSICCVSVLTPPIGRFSVTLTRVLMSMRIQSRAILKSVRIYAFLQKQSSFTRTLKPWFDKSIRSKVKAKDIAFKDKSSIPGAYLQAKADLRKSICQAKVRYCRKLEDCIDSNNARDMWSGVQAIKNYKRAKPSIDTSDNTLPDQLNHFYARFDRDNTEPVPCLTHDISEPAFEIQYFEVKRVINGLNARKAPGPDGISPRLLKSCVDQLTPVLTDLFNWFLKIREVPLCYKSSVIVPVPKKGAVTCLNDYRPVALTAVIMKVFERIILSFINDLLPKNLDPGEYAYRGNRSTDDAVNMCLHHVLQHLERGKHNASNYVRLLSWTLVLHSIRLYHPSYM